MTLIIMTLTITLSILTISITKLDILMCRSASQLKIMAQKCIVMLLIVIASSVVMLSFEAASKV